MPRPRCAHNLGALLVIVLLLLCGLAFSPAAALAQDAAASAPAAVAAVAEAAPAAPAPAKIDTGDTAWMMVSAALVLMMTGPGLALFYSGLVRRKNVLATMMQSFILMAVVTVVWAIIGYTLAFGEGNRFIGGMQFFMLNGVGADPNTDLCGKPL